jgi:hypothetical protein
MWISFIWLKVELNGRYEDFRYHGAEPSGSIRVENLLTRCGTVNILRNLPLWGLLFEFHVHTLQIDIYMSRTVKATENSARDKGRDSEFYL